MKDPVKLKELIIDRMDLAQVMLDYKVHFTFNPNNAQEVQYSCPIHGKDNKPSARYYAESKSCYCFYCKKRWDVISFIMDMEQINFYRAMKFVVDKYKIDISALPDNPEFEKEKKEYSDINVQFLLLRELLLDMKYKLDLEKYKSLYYAYFILEGMYSEPNLEEKLNKLENKIIEVRGRI